VVIILYYDTQVRLPGHTIEDRGESVEMIRVTSAMAAWSPALKVLYEGARRNVLTDLFNRLYVALTRAEKECYLIAVGDLQKPPGFPSRALSVVQRGGTKPLVVSREAERGGYGTAPVTPLHVKGPGIVPVAAQKPLGYWATQRGEALHAILARLDFVVEPEAALANVAHGLPFSEWEEVKSVLVGFLSHPDVACYFAPRPGRSVLNEQEYVARGGNLLRVDRIVVDPGEVTVVDFKTGVTGADEEYDLQIRRYMDVMRDIYPGRAIAGIIAYVDRRIVRRAL